MEVWEKVDIGGFFVWEIWNNGGKWTKIEENAKSEKRKKYRQIK